MIDKLVTTIVASFNEMGKDKSNDLFLSLHNYLINVKKVIGDNNYKLPILRKQE